ncbi:MAG: type II toxin-antitoxin system VapC family toxin [Deltaproteobacteria bacterium]
MIWVIDASIAVRWFLEDESHPHADAVLRRLVDRPELFAVPELFCFEVFSVLCRIHPKSRDVYINGMIPIINGGMLRQPMTETLVNDSAIFVAMGLTGYDACYAALALELKGSWLTFDEKAHRAIEKEGLSHNLFSDLPDRWE